MPPLQLHQLRAHLQANPLPPQTEFPDLYEPENIQRSKTYTALLNYLAYCNTAHNALVGLQAIVSEAESLDHEMVRNWVAQQMPFFENDIMGFGISYMDSGSNGEGHLNLPKFNEYVDKTPFLPLIQYWECMWLLWSGKYHKTKEERTPVNEQGYYYQAPSPEETGDFEKVLSLLKK